MLHDHLDKLATFHPGSEFAFHGHRCVRAKEAAGIVNCLANALLTGGVLSGDRVAILSRNSIEYALLFPAISKAGAVAVPLNTRLLSSEWKFILDDCGATVLFASAEFVSRIDAVRHMLPGITRFVNMGDSAGAGWASWPELVSGQSDFEPVIRHRSDSDALQLYTSGTTSGTTGLPKGVVLTHAGWDAATSPEVNPWRCAAGGRALLVLPMFHIFGLALTCLSVRWGSCLYILDDFNPIETVRILDEEEIQFAAMVPSMIQACLMPAASAARRRFPALRLIVYGASPIAETTLRRAIDAFGCGFVQLYGLTEFSPISALSPEDHRRALSGNPELLLSAGRALADVELRVAGPEGESLPPRVPGEIVVRGAHGMRVYWKQPQATADLIRDGWVRTGDAGVLDEDGYLFIRDRLNDTIVSGGENIYPYEVEAVLAEVPDVADAAVIGVPHELWGESVKAVIVLRRGATLSERDVIVFCRSRMAGYKVPASVDFVERLPRNPAGMVLKQQLREPWWKGRERRVGGA